ncbi:MAG TPA: polysaccharide deacetylase family protein [Chitinophagaceae bacterium]|nr:polysaccharide deacetylase family protein [Chitinophagaceae bacterium]
MLLLKKYFIYLLNKIPSVRVFKYYFSSKNNTNIGVVITFHRVTKDDKKDNSDFNSFIEISGSKLEETILNLKKLEVKFVSLNELSCYLDKDEKPGSPLVHFSFDDGYLDNYLLAFPLLQKHKIPFSIFVTSDFIDYDQAFLWWYIIEYIIKNELPVYFTKYNFEIAEDDYRKDKEILFEVFRTFLLEYIDIDRAYISEQLLKYAGKNFEWSKIEMMKWPQLGEMLLSGLCELGVHTRSHARFCKLTDLQKTKEILDCKDAIYKNTRVVSKYFAYPYGSENDIGNTEGLKKILTDCGMQLAFTTVPRELNRKSEKFFLPRIFINNSATMYTLKSRLNGSFQRGIYSK